MSGASNTLAREFLTDVHQLCSAVAQRAEAREEDEEESHMVALGEYLVRGRGFLLLSTLDSIIDQELTCREELLTLLLSLLPLVWKIPVQEEKAPDFTLPSLLEVFLSREVKAIPLRAGQKAATDDQNSGKRSRVGSGTWKSRRSRRTAQRYSVKDARKSQVSTSDSEANSEDKAVQGPGGARSRRSHGSTIRVSCQHHRSEASQSTSTASTTTDIMSAPYPHPRAPGSQTADTETLTDPAAISIFNRMENSPFDLCHVLLSLLEKVCKFDMSINHNPGLAVSVVPTLTEILTEFGDCCGPGGGGGGGTGAEELAGGWTEEPIALVQRMLLRTILHLMSVDVSQSETLPDSLRRSLTDLLRATLKIRSCLDRQTDPFAPRPKKTLQEVQDDFSFSRYRHRALLLPELLEGVLQVLLGCLQASTPNPFFFSQALELIHEFVQHRGLELFEATVLRLEGLGRARDSEVGGEASERLRGLIAGVFKIISAVKKAKSEQLHQSVCARRRHRRCEYSHFLHHHRDLSGLPVSAFKQAARRNPFEEDGDGKDGMEGDAVRYPERCCCLAACAHQCLRLLQRLSPSGPAVLQVLAGVQAVGICCCMDPRSVVGPLLHAFQAPGLRSYQSHVLSVLGRLILDQLGGGQPSEKAKLASCNICTLDSSQLPGLEETLQHGEPSSISTSLCYRSQGILPSGGGAEDMLWKWDALEAYQELVFGEDWQLSQQIAGHVCHLTLRGNAIVQWQLYTHIFNPVLQRGVELAHHAQQLGVSTVCTQVCSYHTQCLPVEVLLIYLQTLPALLKSRVIRDLFVSCNGLNQVTELVYLDQTRSLALKVFETLIIGIGHQQVYGVLQELESADAEEREAVLGLAEELGSRGVGEGPQSLSKFYEGLKEAYPRHKSRSGQGRGPGRSRAETHLHVINLFLCVAFLCVSKEADSDRDSANDSEDTSGYDSTASEPLGGRLPYLSPDSVALPSKEQVRRAADVWSVCRWIYLASPLFQRQFFRLGGLDVCLRLMAMVIQKLSCKTKDGKAKKKRDGKGKGSPESTAPAASLGQEETTHDPADAHGTGTAEGKTKDPAKKLEEEWQLQSIRLLEALLAICLHSANSALQRIEPELSYQLQSVEETLFEVRDQLSRSGVVNSDLAVPLFDSLLRVALAEVSSCPDPPEEKPDRQLLSPRCDLSEEVDEAQSCGVKPPGEEEGYDADSESNPEDMAKQEEGVKVESAVMREFAAVADGPGRGVLLFPEICTMELQLLATGSPDLEVLSHVFHSLLDAVHANCRNAALLYDQFIYVLHFFLSSAVRNMTNPLFWSSQGGVRTILSGFHNILSQTDPSFTGLFFLLEILLKGILQVVEANVNMEPLHFLTFPIILGGSTPGGVSPGSRQNGAAGGKSVGLLWKGKLSPGRREGDADYRLSHLRSSPWHIAPLHLPLVGQNCWPHMASGFSASMWLRVAEQEEKDGDKDKDKPVLRFSSHCFPEESNPPAAESHHASSQAGTRLVEESLIHILSMGSKALMLQVWADFSTGSLTFRICIDPNDEIKAGLLAQADSGEGLLRPGQWQHLGLTYTQQPEGKKNIHGRVVVWVFSLDYTLPRKSSLSSDSNKTFCMLGHCTPSCEELLKQGGHWSMGTVLLFNGSRIGSEEAFYLYTSGPDLTSIMPCKYGKPSGTFSKFVTQEGLKCEHVREILMKSKDVDTTALVESLAVVYAPSSPRAYTIYEPVIRLKGQAKTVVTQRPFSSKEVQSISLEPSALKALLPTETQGLQSVLHKIGGTGNFVFLLAQTVELSDCEKTQALALRVLLSLSKFNQHRIHEMDCYHGYSMIHQTLLDGCCSGPILVLGDDGQFRLDTESIAVVQDIRLLSDILLDWKIWAKAECGVWETLLAALEILIRVHHPHQVFNIRQLLKAEVVHRFLLACQVLQEHRDEHLTAIPQEVCLSFVKIIQEVLGSPPDMDLLKLIYNFLLAVHPPTNTYVCHTPSSFYFSLHIDGKLYQEKVQSIMYLRHSNSGGKSASSSVVSLSPTVFADAPHEGTAAASLRPPSLAPSPYSSPLLTPRHGHGSSNEAGEGDGVSLATQQARGSTETLKKGGGGGGGGGGDEQLLSSCESAKTICDSKDVGEGGALRTPSISVEEERDEAAEVDSLAEGSVGVAESEDRFDWASDEAPRRPDSLKGIQSFQRSHSNLASLGLAFPAPNGSLAIGRWPSVADRGSMPEDWESYTYSPGYERAHSKTDTEDCLVLICCGLYDLLRGVLLLLPDLMLEEVMDKLIQPEALIVLVNHSSPLIQQGVMKLLDAYFSRAIKEQKEKFLKNHGFSLLANQLYIHQGSQGLLECFLEMLFGRPVGLEEDLDLEEMENISPFRKRCIIPVLGLIENSLYENSLVHNILCMLLQLLNACPKLADILLDHGLLYVLFNTLSTLNGMENGIPLNDYKLLVCDIQQLLVAVTIHSCSSSGSQYFRIIEDLITLLGFMQTSKMRRTQEMAVALQFRVLQSAIEFIKTTANQEPQKLSSSVNAPSSPHHAIYQKRKSIAGRRRFSLAQTDSLLMRMRSVASDELNQMMQRRMSQENPIRASETEFVQRLQRLVVLAVNRLIYYGNKKNLFSPHLSILISIFSLRSNPGSKSFQKDILKLMMDGIKISLGSTGRGGAPHQQWRRILWSCRDTFRVQIGRLLVHTLSPALPLSDRKEALEFVFDPRHLDILKESLSPGLEVSVKDITCLLCVSRLDGKSKDISKIAADITQNVSLRQGMERKKVIQHIRGLYKTDLSASRHWQELVQQLTHDRAVWYDQTSYPTSWQLDPTEGPNRERRRLQRCYLTIPNKYLLKDRRKPEDTVKPALSFLFEDKTHSSFSSTVKDKATSEPIRFTRRCISVAPSRETAGELLLGKSLTVAHSCSMHNILRQSQGTKTNVLSLGH
uniref:Lysosomal trafficking regulator n=1 Tax=Lates calcarifer TaxID=8187 RepID=A0A4W6CCZ4_LATCA